MKFFPTLILVITSIVFTNCQSSWNSVSGSGNVISESRATSSYDGIDVSGFYDIDLIPGTEGQLTLKGDDNLLDYVVTEVVNNTLHIYTKNGSNLNSSKGIRITVPFESLSSAKLTGSGSIITTTTIKSKTFEASITGSGDIEIPIEAETVDANVTGSGDLKLTGKTEQFNCNVTGSGDIVADELKANKANAHVSGSGDIVLFAKEYLKADVTGSGDISYIGTPEKRDFSTTGSGDISRR